MQNFIAGLLLLLAFFVGIIGAIFGRSSDRRRVSDDTDSARAIDSGLEQSKVGLEHGKERINAGTESIDRSIERLKDASALLESIKKRNDDMAVK